MHFNTNVLIEFQSPERAFVETYVLVLQRFRPGGLGVPPEAAGLRNMASARYMTASRSATANGASCTVRSSLVISSASL
jgi:hypothetical protein